MSYESLQEDFVQSSSIRPGRRIWELSPESNGSEWTAVFLDAELYIERVKVVEVTKRLQSGGRIPPTRSIFASNENADARHTDYVCNPEYAHFISQDVVPWLLNKPSQTDPGRVIVVGLSLSGLAAAHVVLTNPSLFRTAICQSPSFWWHDESLRSSVQRAGEASTPFWVSVGNEETEQDVSHPPSGMFQKTSQIDACQRAYETLKVNNYEVRYRVFNGGHEPDCWAEDLELALPWAMRQA